ncbi:MAG: Holliday junction branch migration protein RuvA, partial [Candidatus Nanopelagicales bacterium]
FLSAPDRDAFQILQSVSGIGPRIAMAALATYSADELRTIVARKDEAALTKISGIGKKGAQRLILELVDKLGPPVGTSAESRANAQASGNESWQGQVREALVGLGWSAREAEEAVAVAEAEQRLGAATDGASDSEPSVADMLARVLRGMSRR